MEKEIETINKQISECYAMIDHFIQLKERGIPYASSEIKEWRKYLQCAKKAKRRLINT